MRSEIIVVEAVSRAAEWACGEFAAHRSAATGSGDLGGRMVAENGLLPMKDAAGDLISVDYKSVRNVILENRGSKFACSSVHKQYETVRF